ncbi:peptide ABC transporter ATP-binding protein, partial [Rhodococcus sp. MS16]|nr:peptide ABC transporter ATP-binding protein [Rhodococcus sp. MS16]
DMQNRALHPYTQLLLSSIPDPDATVTAAQNVDQKVVELPSPLNPPSGCRFRTRCPLATDRCAEEVPELRLVDGGHQVACHNV